MVGGHLVPNSENSCEGCVGGAGSTEGVFKVLGRECAVLVPTGVCVSRLGLGAGNGGGSRAH